MSQVSCLLSLHLLKFHRLWDTILFSHRLCLSFSLVRNLSLSLSSGRDAQFFAECVCFFFQSLSYSAAL